METLLKVFGEAGIQWMGWGLAAALVILYVRREQRILDVINKNTTAITTLTVLFTERLPSGGGK